MRNIIIWLFGALIFIVMMSGTLLDWSEKTRESRSSRSESLKTPLNFLAELHSEIAKSEGIYRNVLTKGEINADQFIKNGKYQSDKFQNLVNRSEIVFVSSKYDSCRNAVFEAKVLWKYKYDYVTNILEQIKYKIGNENSYSIQENIYRSQEALNRLLSSCLYVLTKN